MHIEPVEIYSDATNRGILRQPGRRFPGILVQGDTMYGLCQDADKVCALVASKLSDEENEEVNDLRNRLWEFLVHYKKVLAEHHMQLPFSEDPSS